MTRGQQATLTIASVSASAFCHCSTPRLSLHLKNPHKPSRSYLANLHVLTFSLSFLPYLFLAFISPPPRPEWTNLRPHFHLNIRPKGFTSKCPLSGHIFHRTHAVLRITRCPWVLQAVPIPQKPVCIQTPSVRTTETAAETLTTSSPATLRTSV